MRTSRWGALRRATALGAVVLVVAVGLAGCSASSATSSGLPKGVTVSLFRIVPTTRSDTSRCSAQHDQVDGHHQVGIVCFHLLRQARAYAVRAIRPRTRRRGRISRRAAGGIVQQPETLAQSIPPFHGLRRKRHRHGDSKGALQPNEIHSHDCALEAFEKVVAITPGAAVTWSTNSSGALVSHLELDLTPTGAAGTVTLNSIENTTLLDLTLNTDYPLVLSSSSKPLKLSPDPVPRPVRAHARRGQNRDGRAVPCHDVGIFERLFRPRAQQQTQVRSRSPDGTG